MDRTSVLQQLVELVRSATSAVSAELVLLGDPAFHLQSGDHQIGFDEHWAGLIKLDQDVIPAGCNDWVQSFVSIPVTGPSAEAGWISVASDVRGHFTPCAVESTQRIAELIEHHLDQNTERSRVDQISAVLHTNQEELKTTRDQLAAANADLEQFAYLAAHELVAPLRSVSVYAEVLRSLATDEDSSATHMQQCTDAISEGVTTMNKQIQYLLEFSRAQDIGTDLRPIDLTTVISTAIDTLAEPIEEANAIIRIGDLPYVPGREIPLQSVFANLIGNAVNYRHPSRQLEIDIRSEVNNGECRITVSDNGVGVDGEDSSRIFQLFERASTTASGTGIGLALTRRIVEAHGGEIGVEPGSPSGSVFWIELPEAELV